jgi:hypothetical protein
LIEALRRRGLATVSPDDRRAMEAHARFRAATDHYVRAYAENAGYDLATARARYSRWDRDTALVGRGEVDDDESGAVDEDSPPLIPERRAPEPLLSGTADGQR